MQADPPAGNSSKPAKTQKTSRGVVWLKDGDYVRPVEVKAGTSDGSDTAVTADNLPEGAEVVTGETIGSTQAATKNPFVPQIIRR
jgi:multidrug efflux pump subunit AcrA (membrane-fusion protein)